jgi:hypothetical protein
MFGLTPWKRVLPRLLPVLAVAVLSAGTARAHDPSLIKVDVRFDGKGGYTVELRLDVNVLYGKIALFSPVDKARMEPLIVDDPDEMRTGFQKYFLKKMGFLFDDKADAPALEFLPNPDPVLDGDAPSPMYGLIRATGRVPKGALHFRYRCDPRLFPAAFSLWRPGEKEPATELLLGKQRDGSKAYEIGDVMSTTERRAASAPVENDAGVVDVGPGPTLESSVTIDESDGVIGTPDPGNVPNPQTVTVTAIHRLGISGLPPPDGGFYPATDILTTQPAVSVGEIPPPLLRPTPGQYLRAGFARFLWRSPGFSAFVLALLLLPAGIRRGLWQTGLYAVALAGGFMLLPGAGESLRFLLGASVFLMAALNIPRPENSWQWLDGFRLALAFGIGLLHGSILSGALPLPELATLSARSIYFAGAVLAGVAVSLLSFGVFAEPAESKTSRHLAAVVVLSLLAVGGVALTVVRLLA